MALVVTIEGATRNVQSMSLSAAQNDRDRLTATLISEIGADIRPNMDDEVLVTEDGTTIFGGSVKTPELSGVGDSRATQARISALDFNELGDRQTVTMTIAAGTLLKAAATLLLPYLEGVAIDSTWTADGPAVPELVYEDVYAEAVLADLAQRSGWLRNINYDKKLKFWEPGTVPAPWNVADGDGNTLGDLSVSISRQDYANRIIVKFADVARKAYAYVWMPSGNFANGETVTVGSKTYTFQDTLTDADGNVHISHVNGAGSLTNLGAAIRLTGGDYAASMTVHPQVTSWENRADLLTVQALAPGASGNSIAVSDTTANSSWIGEGAAPMTTLLNGADEALTNRVVRNNLTEQASYDIYTRVIEAPNVYTEASANALGDAVLLESIVSQSTLNYMTTRAGLVPGMTQTIVCANRFVSGSYLITAVETSWGPDVPLAYREVTAISGTIFKNNAWREQYKKWSGVSGASTSTSWSGVVGAAAPSRIVYALGGSRSLLVTPATSAWTPIAEWCPAKATEAFEARVRCWLWAAHAGIEVQARLVSGTDGVTFATVVNTMAVTTGTTPVERTATFTAGVNLYYRLEVKPTTAGEGCGCLGYLESA